MRATILILWMLLQGAPLTATWDGPVLRVTRSAGCLVLVGNNLPDRHLSDVGCDASPVALPSGGVDHLEAPEGRTLLLVEPASGQTLARLAVPPREWRVILPLVAR